MAEFQAVRGMRDFLPGMAVKKQWIEAVCRSVFGRYGFVPLQTPVVEDFGLLAKKGSGGEAIKEEIYYFKDKGGRELGLRFDLTVPLGRIMAENKQLPRPFKRYQIGTVYRYDRPGEKRYREFTQADWDILGSEGALADFETIAVAIDVMKELGFKKGEFFVKVNSRPLLEEVAMCCGVEKEKIADCFRCIDKLDKIGKEGVEKELKEKGINTQILGQIGGKKPEELKVKNPAPLDELKKLLELAEKNSLQDFVKLDLSLARGLEYYTGIVFEVCIKGCPSVGGGGRYDKLVELYGGQPTPAVGCSFGIDRLLDVLAEKINAKPPAEILVVPVGEKMQLPALELAQKIRSLGIACILDLNGRGVSKNLEYANKTGIPFAAIFGENEAKKKEFTLKEMKAGKEKKVKIADLKKLKDKLK